MAHIVLQTQSNSLVFDNDTAKTVPYLAVKYNGTQYSSQLSTTGNGSFAVNVNGTKYKNVIPTGDIYNIVKNTSGVITSVTGPLVVYDVTAGTFYYGTGLSIPASHTVKVITTPTNSTPLSTTDLTSFLTSFYNTASKIAFLDEITSWQGLAGSCPTKFYVNSSTAEAYTVNYTAGNLTLKVNSYSSNWDSLGTSNILLINTPATGGTSHSFSLANAASSAQTVANGYCQAIGFKGNIDILAGSTTATVTFYKCFGYPV